MGQSDPYCQGNARVSTSRIALVTGAARGIGLAIARALAAAGHRVVLCDRDGAALEEASAGFVENTVMAMVADIGDLAAPRYLQSSIEKLWGPVTILVNNAGIPSSKRDGLAAGLQTLTDAEWNEVLDINLGAPFRLCRQFVGGMAEAGWGRVINMASMAGRTRSLIASSNYMASKAGVIALTRSIASEFGPCGVTANAIAPGLIATPMAALRPAAANEEVIRQIPLRRMGLASEVACAAAYLASDDAGFVNGAVLDINGGVFMG